MLFYWGSIYFGRACIDSDPNPSVSHDRWKFLHPGNKFLKKIPWKVFRSTFFIGRAVLFWDFYYWPINRRWQLNKGFKKGEESSCFVGSWKYSRLSLYGHVSVRQTPRAGHLSNKMDRWCQSQDICLREGWLKSSDKQTRGQGCVRLSPHLSLHQYFILWVF